MYVYIYIYSGSGAARSLVVGRGRLPWRRAWQRRLMFELDLESEQNYDDAPEKSAMMVELHGLGCERLDQTWGGRSQAEGPG